MPRPPGRPRKPAKPPRRKAGQGSLRYHRPSNRWRATLPPHLDPARRAVYFPSRAEAEAWLTSELARAAVTTGTLSGATQLGAYLLRYLQQQSASADWSPRTLASAATNADYLAALYERRLDSLTRDDLQAVVVRLLSAAERTYRRPNGTTYTRSRPLGSGALHNAVGLWRRAFARAVEDGLMRFNPASRLTLPPLASERAASWTPAEARRLVPALRTSRFEAVYALIFGCGLRIGEARGLAWADVDWTHARIWVHQQADGPRILDRVKGRAGKWVPLPEPVVAALRRQQHRQPWAATYVSEWHNGWRICRVSRDTLVSDLRALAASVGVRPLPPHAGRHAVGNVLGAAGVPLAVISDRLRHRSRATTSQWYLSSDDEGEDRASELLAGLFSEGVSAC